MSRRFRGVGRITGLGGGSVLAAVTAGVSAGVGVGSWLTKSNAAHRPSRPLLRFGVIADVQYCDIPDAWNFSGNVKRHYRGALDCLRNAVRRWNAGPEIAFVANLGDIVDQANEKRGESESALAAVLAEFGKVNTAMALPEDWVATTPGEARPFVFHLIGNHELYNFTRQQLREGLGTNPPPEGTSYYSFSPHRTLRCVVLDPYDLNTIDNREHDDAHTEGYKYLEQFNKTDLRGRGTANWTEGLRGLKKRFVPFNGAVRPPQMAWLEATLREADENQERVVVMSHLPMQPGACKDVCLLWNYEEALALFHAHPCVVAVFAGHDHDGGYRRDGHGIHHVTFQSPLNSKPEPAAPKSALECFAEDSQPAVGEGEQEGEQEGDADEKGAGAIEARWAALGEEGQALYEAKAAEERERHKEESRVALLAHATVEVWPDRLELLGEGIVSTRTLTFERYDPPISPQRRHFFHHRHGGHHHGGHAGHGGKREGDKRRDEGREHKGSSGQERNRGKPDHRHGSPKRQEGHDRRGQKQQKGPPDEFVLKVEPGAAKRRGQEE